MPKVLPTIARINLGARLASFRRATGSALTQSELAEIDREDGVADAKRLRKEQLLGRVRRDVSWICGVSGL